MLALELFAKKSFNSRYKTHQLLCRLKRKQFSIILKALAIRANKKTSRAWPGSQPPPPVSPLPWDFTRLVANVDKTSPVGAVLAELIRFEVESLARSSANQASDSINLLWLCSE